MRVNQLLTKCQMYVYANRFESHGIYDLNDLIRLYLLKQLKTKISQLVKEEHQSYLYQQFTRCVCRSLCIDALIVIVTLILVYEIL